MSDVIPLYAGGSPLRRLRPTLLDFRFRGDPWILEQPDGSLALCLGNFHLGSINGVPLDVPSLNQLLDRVRHRGPRRAECCLA